MDPSEQLKTESEPSPRLLDVPPLELTLRVAWIALRLVLVGALAAQGTYFFYQGF